MNMNLITKKRIAKEILYFFTGIIILLIFWVFIEIQNSYYQNKVITYNKEITKLQIQIKEFAIKPVLQPDKLNKLNENAKIMSESGSSEEDIIAMKDAVVKRFGRKYTLSEEIKFDNLKKNLQLETNKLNEAYLKFLSRDDILFLSIILFVLIYPIRIIFILVKWAIKTLKN